MNQKWNLQDIRPVDRSPKKPTGTSLEIHSNQASEIRAPRARRHETRPSMNDMRKDSATHRSKHPESLDTDTEDSFESADDIAYAPTDRIPVVDGHKRRRKHYIVAAFAFIFIIGSAIAISQARGGATVVIEPKTRSINVNAEFTAYKTPQPDELSYEIMTIEATGERQVSATGQEEVKVQATGEIEISKSTASAERLIKNTRFETADGLVFRIEESVIVPGAVTDSSGKSVPGTIRAKVFADEAGDTFNIAANTKMMVPGFKEGNYMDLYNSISAVNPVAFTNGFAGPKFIIAESELATARQALQTSLRDTLLTRIATEKPAGFTTFPDSIAITYAQLPAVPYGENLVTIKEQAILQIPLFKEDDFATFIAKETMADYSGEGVRIANIDTLKFAYSSATTSQTNIANLDELTFTISGVPQIVWTFDEGKLKVDLMGAEKSAIPQIIGGYRGVEKSDVKIRPVWKRTVPKSLDKITIIEEVSTPK